MQIQLQSSDELAERIANAVSPEARPVVFLFGSGVCLPKADRPGVPGSKEIIGLIQAELGTSWEPVDSYQAAFDLLIRRRGLDTANRVVRRAVLQARMDRGKGVAAIAAPTRAELEALEAEAGAWAVPRGLAAAATLCAHFPKAFGRTVLTTNFDPLIEISLAQQGAGYFSSALHADGSLLYLGGHGTHVVHLHGFWRGSDTLHTPSQLLQPRPQLADSLRSILHDVTLVVLGYGGWDDVVMQTISEVLSGNSVSVDILWGFHESDDAVIAARYGHVLAKLQSALARGRAHLYKEVAADNVLPSAFNKAVGIRPAQDLPTFLRRVELARTGRVLYAGLEEPWGQPSTSLGEYAKLLYELDPNTALRAALMAAEYVLPYLEKQVPHSAPKPSPDYAYARKLVKEASALLDSRHRELDEESFRALLFELHAAGVRLQGAPGDKFALLTVFYASCAVLSHFRDVESLRGLADPDFPPRDWVARAIHTGARCMHNDDVAIWSYLSRRIGGGPNHLGRFW